MTRILLIIFVGLSAGPQFSESKSSLPWQSVQTQMARDTDTRHARNIAAEFMRYIYEGVELGAHNPYADSLRSISGFFEPGQGGDEGIIVIDTFYIRDISFNNSDSSFKIGLMYRQIMVIENDLYVIEKREYLSDWLKVRGSKVIVPPSVGLVTGRPGVIWWLKELMKDGRQGVKAKKLLLRFQRE